MSDKNNSGIGNTGVGNTGDMNTGYWNSGNGNSGYCNSGSWNSGNWNSGIRNSGDWNSGNGNSGDMNSGSWNSGNFNSGCFNTNSPKLRIFNKETDTKLKDIPFPNYFCFDLTEVIDGKLKVYDYKEAWIKSFNEKCYKEQAEQTINLPNFDYAIFEEITGITKEMLDKKRGITTEDSKDIVVINGVKYKRCQDE